MSTEEEVGVTNIGGVGALMANMNDPLALANSDHPGAQSVTNVFNGMNFLGWSRGITMALGAKLKLGFIDGSLTKNNLSPVDLQRWTRCDFMIRCWILNSMTARLSESFMYPESARHLWEEIVERYAQSNGPLLFQLRKEMSNLVQGAMSVSDYYGKLKKLWDEIFSLEGTVECTCGAYRNCTCGVKKKLQDIDNRNKVLQFLMGLNDGYESVRNRILTQEPIPSINKAYYMVQQVDKSPAGDKSGASSSSIASNALAANRNGDRNGDRSGDNRKPLRKDKENKQCSHCNMKGHLKSECFRIIGYPEWFNQPKGKGNGRSQANVAENGDLPLDENKGSSSQHTDASLVSALENVLRAMKGKGPAYSDTYSAGP